MLRNHAKKIRVKSSHSSSLGSCKLYINYEIYETISIFSQALTPTDGTISFNDRRYLKRSISTSAGAT